MNNPLISVPIPVYKIASYLEACIKSVVSQTYPNLDIVLLVQPCDDASAEIASSWVKRDVRIRVVNLPFADLANARNEGVKNSFGDIICFVDGDDIIHSDHIARMYGVMEETGADIVQAKVYAFHNEAALPDEIPGSGKVDVMSGREFELNRQQGIFGSWATVVQTKLYKKELFEGVSFPTGRICEDVATTFRLYAKAEKMALLDLESYFYRSGRGDSITHDENQRRRLLEQGYLATKDIWDYYNGYDPKLTAFCAYYLCNHVVRAKATVPWKQFKDSDILMEMKRMHHTYMRSCSGRFIGKKRRLLTILGRILPKVWYHLNEERTKKARQIEWKDKE